MNKDIKLAGINFKSSELICLIGFILACGLLMIPLQKFITLSRFQHYGLACLIFGTSYLLQGIVSWNSIKKWGRRSYFVSAAFFISIAVYFISSPWLDSKIGLQTEEQKLFTRIMTGNYFLVSFLVVYVWWRFYQERKK